ncbi:TPA: Csu type fimbrial protein [Pseudomonas aeruginosa]
MNKRTPAVLLFCSCASLLGTAQATGTLIGQVGVQMVIGAGCTIINGSVSGGINQWGTLDFGSHSDLTNVVDAQTVGTSGNIQIQCSTGLTPSLTVNAGLHASGGQRYMQNTTTSSSTIAYNIYSDAARSALIQANTPVDISSVSTGTAVNIPLYGRVVPTGQSTPTPTAGTYTDTLLVTIAW